MKKKSENLKTLEKIRKEQGKTNWAKLIAEEKNANVEMRQAQKTRR